MLTQARLSMHAIHGRQKVDGTSETSIFPCNSDSKNFTGSCASSLLR